MHHHAVRSALLAFALPGWAAVRRHGGHRWLGGVLLVTGVLAPLLLVAEVLFAHRSLVAASLDRGVLLRAVVVLLLAAASRVVAVTVAWSEHRSHASHGPGGWVFPVALVVCLAFVAGAGAVIAARQDLEPVFTPVADGPLFDPASVPDPVGTVPPISSVADGGIDEPATTLFVGGPDGPAPDPGPLQPGRGRPRRPRSGVDPAVLADVHTVLLLGGDAGPDRSGLRTDTMMLFSLHEPSGRASLISIPRDMRNLLFVPTSELGRRHPMGWDDLANAVYPLVSADPELRAAYEVEGIRPGIVALVEALGYSFDVVIDDYVLVDMQGFVDLVDALGGVTVEVTREIPMPGNIPGAPTQYPDVIGPGTVTMDGSTALGYVRSRKGDSDYQRTARQRDLLESLATQIDTGSVLGNFPQIAAAVGGTLRTSLAPDELAEILAVIGGRTAIVESVGLVPPLVDVAEPDFQELARIVGAVQTALVTGTPSGY